MAANMVFADVESQRYVAVVGNDVAPGTPMLLGGVPVVTITGSGDYDGNAVTFTANGVTTTLAGGRGGVGLADTQATVSPTGAYAFDVTGASAGAVTEGVTQVYITSGGVLTLTSSGNTRFGIAELFRGELSATDTVVRIGV
jgi:hypothetical protein